MWLTKAPETKGAVVNYIKHERKDMATALERKRNKAYKPGQYTKQPSFGDIVKLAAISTRDVHHRIRHELLWLEYEVISVAPASPEKNGYNYKGWWSLILSPTAGTRKHPKGADILFMTCQVKILYKKSLFNPAYKQNSRISKILFEINEVIANPNSMEGNRIVIFNNDKPAWRKLAKSGLYTIEWRNLANDRPKWKLVTTLFPYITNQPSIEFRVRPDRQRLEFNKRYKLKGAI